eukprot:4870954-Pleurochrysis_carterae.AAC.1
MLVGLGGARARRQREQLQPRRTGAPRVQNERFGNFSTEIATSTSCAADSRKADPRACARGDLEQRASRVAGASR